MMIVPILSLLLESGCIEFRKAGLTACPYLGNPRELEPRVELELVGEIMSRFRLKS